MPLSEAIILRFLKPLYFLTNPGYSRSSPMLSGNDISFPIIFSSILTYPSFGFISPLIALISIVLPLPFLPHIPYILPLSIFIFILSNKIFFFIFFV